MHKERQRDNRYRETVCVRERREERNKEKRRLTERERVCVFVCL
jgi:hypothetical protein